MDLTKAAAPKSDQINAEDLLSGPRVFTIDRVVEGSDEQPVNIHLVEMPGRPWRPAKTVIRLLIKCWGPITKDYPGRRVLLYRDPEVKWGGAKVGGIRLESVSHIDRPVDVVLAITKGQRRPFTVTVLKDVQQGQNRPGTVPDQVIQNTKRAVAEGKVPVYLENLQGKGAPDFILEYVRAHLPEEDGPPEGMEPSTGELPAEPRQERQERQEHPLPPQEDVDAAWGLDQEPPAEEDR